jgi:hypothetical protein
MSDSHHSRFMRSACQGIALVAVVLLQPAALATTNKNTSDAVKSLVLDVPSHRRCEWTPKKEHCYWVKSDGKIITH